MQSAPCATTERWSTPATGNRSPEGAAARSAPHNRGPGMMNEGDRPAVGGTGSGFQRAASTPERGEDGAHEQAQDLGRQLSVVGQAVAQSEGQRKDPLAYGNSRQHPVHEVRRRVGHMPTAARRAKTAPFTRERHHPIQATAVAVNAQESVRKNSAVQEGAQLTLDEAWKDSFPDAGICQPGLEVMLDHAVESRCLGAARGVFGGRSCLAWFSHEQIVGPGSCQNQEVSSFEFPQCNVHEESCGARLSEIRRNPYTCLTRNLSTRVALVQLTESMEPSVNPAVRTGSARRRPRTAVRRPQPPRSGSSGSARRLPPRSRRFRRSRHL